MDRLLPTARPPKHKSGPIAVNSLDKSAVYRGNSIPFPADKNRAGAAKRLANQAAFCAAGLWWRVVFFPPLYTGPVGELKLAVAQGEMRFELMLENNWRERIKRAVN